MTSKRTIFNLLRYLAACTVEGNTEQLTKEQLKEKLADEELIFIGTNLDCVYDLYVKYIEEYKSESELFKYL